MEQTVIPTMKIPEPDWFRIGRDAVRVMARLSGMRELDFYLRHPEPFIRLHAIRRVAELMLPDAVPALAKRLDDPLENEQNRDEAGWAIRRICKYKGVSWFAKTPWTDRYDGSETAAHRYGVKLVAGDDSTPATPPAGDLSVDAAEDEVLLRIQMDEQDLHISFSVIPWFARNARYLLAGTAKGLLFILVRLGKVLLRAVAVLGRTIRTGWKQLFSLLKARPSHARKKPGTLPNTAVPTSEGLSLAPALAGFPTDASGNGSPVSGSPPLAPSPATFLIGAQEAGYASADRLPQRPAIPPGPVSQAAAPLSRQSSQHAIERLRYGNPVPAVGRRKHSKGGNAMFRLLFYPVRLVRNHWVFTLLVLVAFYALLGFSSPGRRFVYQINPRAQLANDRLVSVTRVAAADFLGLSRTEDQEEAGTTEPVTEDAAAASVPLAVTASDNAETRLAGARTVQVTAPKGLNLRKTPEGTGEKVVWMKLGDSVTLMGVSQTDGEGNLWQTVQYKEQTGWALDKWLSPEAEGAAHDGS